MALESAARLQLQLQLQLHRGGADAQAAGAQVAARGKKEIVVDANPGGRAEGEVAGRWQNPNSGFSHANSWKMIPVRLMTAVSVRNRGVG